MTRCETCDRPVAESLPAREGECAYRAMRAALDAAETNPAVTDAAYGVLERQTIAAREECRSRPFDWRAEALRLRGLCGEAAGTVASICLCECANQGLAARLRAAAKGER